jgi:predicted MFS family arabinose efflux permease
VGAARSLLGGGIGAVALPAALLLAVVMGQRSSIGLFLSPMNTATGIGFAALSLAVAIGQVTWGLAQPMATVLAERYGPARVIACGAVLCALGNVAVVLATSFVAMVLAIGVGGAAGAAAGGASLLLGLVAQRVSPQRRGLANGIVGAGGSAGQMVVAPLAQGAIAAVGWIGAMLMMAVMTFAVVPLARAFRGEATAQPAQAGRADEAARMRLATARRAALRDPLYWAVSGGFAICGFHVGFLTTHVPGVIESCGLPATLAGTWIAIVGACNIVGSLVSGVLTQTRSMPHMLIALYAARAAGVLLFLAAPKTSAVMLGFAVWMGATYMATVPPTTGVIARRYGAAHLAPLLAVAMLLHQSGSAIGVWLGGLAFEASGHYDWFWSLDIGLALLAAAIHVPLLSRVDGPSRPASTSSTIARSRRQWEPSQNTRLQASQVLNRS